MEKQSTESGRSIIERLATVLADVQGIASDLSKGTRPTRPPSELGIPLAALDAIIQARAVRDHHFGSGLFSDPAWEILLHLFVARLEGSSVTVSDLGAGIGLASTTASPWMNILLDRNLIRRRPDKADGRKVYVELTDNAAERLEACLRDFRSATTRND
jgi:DNA-binding transcriptional ArsR family regulator